MTAVSQPIEQKTLKGERTRGRILETALDLFMSNGYEQTTMRVIARHAGVSLGNAYYYFQSKEQLIQAFYDRTHVEHADACAELLRVEKDFKKRLRGVLQIRMDTNRPYHRFAGVLFKTAADPTSPLNPFSDESLPVRCEATRLFGEVIDGSNMRVGSALSPHLPNLLWLYQMGVVLFWVHDKSPGCRRTQLLIDKSVDLVVAAIRTASLPPFKPILRRTVAMLALLQR